MLLELHIKDFALIDSADLKFEKGLNILTGETGAGKSIVIDSVNFIMGDKQSRDIIRTGAESAYVEGVFDANSEETSHILQENGIDEEDVLIISREINQNGRSISRINGKTVTVSLLKQVMKYIIDIYGQHQHQSLLDEQNHIQILDSFCGSSIIEIKKQYKALYEQIKEIENQIDRINLDEKDRQRKLGLLSYQINEINEAKLKPNEDEELYKKREVLANAEKIYSSLSNAYNILYSSEEQNSSYDGIGSSIGYLEGIEKYDEKLENIKNELKDVYYNLEGIVDEIREYKDNIDFEPDVLNQVEIRLDLINSLKMKYGNSIEEILAYCERSSSELNELVNNNQTIDKLSQKKKDGYIKLNKLAEDISKIRKEVAVKLEDRIEEELRYLGMDKASFKIVVEDNESLNEDGKNKVYFMMTANVGEPLKPLSKVASGGELSRIMLAIKSVIADVDSIPTLIFDEIDTGISGRAAQAVAEKMCLISKNHQVLCVTHLPQIASMADVHFKIEKNIIDGKTYTNVLKLNDKGQTEELARMLGGAILTDLTRKHSIEMKSLANDLKGKIRKT
ncbi:MAG TPA: DNA repair protein RecN [Clostridiaceae bacterium]|jgi:DNA repair protein RecN (Recombination protein N)|nr:DNA repair protein RecN [Clostridiaceae bacterium]HBG37688.1 DNA repair protein RecN [Clostridiaceae bacterium]